MAQIIISNSLNPRNAGGVSITVRVSQEELTPAQRRKLANHLAQDARYEMRNLGIALGDIKTEDTFDESRLDL